MTCQIRKWRLSDAGDLAAALSNRKVQDNLRDGLPYPYTERDGEEYISSVLSGDENDIFAFAIVAEGHVVGSIGAFRQKNIHWQTAELGYYLAEPYWGKGLMTQAVRQICEIIFARGDIIRIYAEPFSDNLGSRGVLEKAGFILEGTMRHGVYKHGTVKSYCVYSLLREEVREM